MWKASTARFRNELLACEAFNTLAEARVLIEQWRVHYNTVRPHSSLGYRPPAPEVILSKVPVPATPPGPAGSAAALGIGLHPPNWSAANKNFSGTLNPEEGVP